MSKSDMPTREMPTRFDVLTRLYTKNKYADSQNVDTVGVLTIIYTKNKYADSRNPSQKNE